VQDARPAMTVMVRQAAALRVLTAALAPGTIHYLSTVYCYCQAGDFDVYAPRALCRMVQGCCQAVPLVAVAANVVWRCCPHQSRDALLWRHTPRVWCCQSCACLRSTWVHLSRCHNCTWCSCRTKRWQPAGPLCLWEQTPSL
jgi:hypothetical protein